MDSDSTPLGQEGFRVLMVALRTHAAYYPMRKPLEIAWGRFSLNDSMIAPLQEILPNVNLVTVTIVNKVEEDAGSEGCFQRLLRILQEQPNLQTLNFRCYFNDIVQFHQVLDTFPPGRFAFVSCEMLRELTPDIVPALAQFVSLARDDFVLNVMYWGPNNGHMMLPLFQAVKMAPSRPRIALSRGSGCEGNHLDHVTQSIISSDVVSKIVMDWERFESYLGPKLASFIDSVQDSNTNKNLTSLHLYVINEGSNIIIGRYNNDQQEDTFEPLTAALSRFSNLQCFEAHCDLSSHELVTDCILPGLRVNPSVTDITISLWLEEVSPARLREIAPAVWTNVNNIIASAHRGLRCINVEVCVSGRRWDEEEGVEVEEDVEFRSVFKEVCEQNSDRLRSALLENFNLETIDLRFVGLDEWKNLVLVVESNDVTDRNQRLRQVRQFVQGQQRMDPNAHPTTTVLVRQKLVEVHAAVAKNPLNITALYEVVRAFLPLADPDLKVRLWQALGVTS
jgi:hypothetical protein